MGSPVDLALGLQKPVESTLGTAARVAYRAILAALEADAVALSTRFSADVLERLGEGKPPSPERQALWHDDEAAVAYRKAELDRARQLAAEGFADQSKLAQEVRW